LGATFQFGQDLIEVIRQPTVVNLIQQVSSEPQIQEAELELPLSKVTLRLRAHPLLETEKSTNAATSSGVLLTVTDETRLKQLENARRDFTANVSHELKTPLSAIKAYAETLLMGALEDEEASHRFVERIAEQAHRLDSLIRDLLHLTKIQSQPDKPQLSNLLLDDVLKTCVEEHRTIGQAKKITIDASGVESDCRVEGDLESLRTIIGNLLGNAVRYNQPEGWVRVSTRRERNHVILVIADNGIGIPPEDLDRIFERFYRVEKARSQDSGGTGLGLSIVKHLVQGMSAEIHVSSVLGKGSSFELKLRSANPTQKVEVQKQ
jgi:two-component system phosphate regulon sensor histidine kinase PhoR